MASGHWRFGDGDIVILLVVLGRRRRLIVGVVGCTSQVTIFCLLALLVVGVFVARSGLIIHGVFVLVVSDVIAQINGPIL